MVLSRADKFLETSLRGLQACLESSWRFENASHVPGFLQGLVAEVKCLVAFSWLLAALLTHRQDVVWLTFGLIILVMVITLSRHVKDIVRQLLLLSGLSILVCLPALMMTPGTAYSSWHYLRVTDAGVESAGLLLARTQVAVAITLLMNFSTPWPAMLRGLRRLGVPGLFTTVLAMTRRYIFLFLETATGLIQARRARILAPLGPRARKELAVSFSGALLQKTMLSSDKIHSAMIARGFRGDFPALQNARWRVADFTFAVIGCAGAMAVLWWGR